jgi:predicted GNAT family acetyltransferase
VLIRSRSRTPQARLLDDRDLPAARALLAEDPVATCFVASRIDAVGLDSWRLGAEMWGVDGPGGGLSALCFAGANLMPVVADESAVRAFADRARHQGRRCSSLVGPAEGTLLLWRYLRPVWGPAREVRADQPLLALAQDPETAVDPLVQPVQPEELDTILPACIAMFTEEVGVSPVQDGTEPYRARVAELIAAGRAFARIEQGRVVFKAEIGAVSQGVCQIQGVWVDPALRGRGLGLQGTAAVVTMARESLAPTVSLYVNSFNHAARRIYDRVGFSQVGTYASILY